MKTPCCKCHSYYCNVHDVGTNSSMFIQGPHSNGLLCHWPGSLYGLGRYNLWFPGKSAPTYCRVKPAHAGCYWKGLKYHWCPTENSEAVFFQLPPNGHLDYHLEHWAASLLTVSVNRDVKSYPRDCQSATSGAAQRRVLLLTSELKLTGDKLWVELPFHSPFYLYKKTVLSRIFSLATPPSVSDSIYVMVLFEESWLTLCGFSNNHLSSKDGRNLPSSSTKPPVARSRNRRWLLHYFITNLL